MIPTLRSTSRSTHRPIQTIARRARKKKSNKMEKNMRSVNSREYRYSINCMRETASSTNRSKRPMNTSKSSTIVSHLMENGACTISSDQFKSTIDRSIALCSFR